MKKVLFLFVYSFLVLTSNAQAGQYYSDEFMGQLCLQANASIRVEVPVELTGYYTYSATPIVSDESDRYMYDTEIQERILQADCEILNEDYDVLEFKVGLEYYRSSKIDQVSSFKANVQCYFTSAYVWSCGYSEIESSSLFVAWTHVQKCSIWEMCRFKNRTVHASPWQSTSFQSEILNAFSSYLNENY